MKENIESTLSHEQLPRSLELARLLERTDDSKKITKYLGLFLDSLAKDIGKECTDKVGQIYERMQAEQCLARVEQLSRVLETIELHKALRISDEEESHYANAVLPVPDGLKIAFSEGRAPGSVRTVVSFGKTIIGFKTGHLLVEKAEFGENEIRDAQERQYLCRHVSGVLETEDIRSLVIRIPFTFMSDRHLTEDEKSKKQPFVFRGIQF